MHSKEIINLAKQKSAEGKSFKKIAEILFKEYFSHMFRNIFEKKILPISKNFYHSNRVMLVLTEFWQLLLLKIAKGFKNNSCVVRIVGLANHEMSDSMTSYFCF